MVLKGRRIIMDDLYSRFKLSEKIIYDDNITIGRWRRYRFLRTRPKQSAIFNFRVTSALEGRPDLIADRIYGIPSLDWVLLAFNNVRETLNWPKTGSIIEYPTSTIILPEILS
jgi:hypothetical protein